MLDPSTTMGHNVNGLYTPIVNNGYRSIVRGLGRIHLRVEAQDCGTEHVCSMYALGDKQCRCYIYTVLTRELD